MIIEIEVSEANESTRNPYWMIIDPQQMMKPDAAQVAMGMISGPFFSREEAEFALRIKRHHYSKRAIVWCAGANDFSQYAKQLEGGRR